MKLLFFSLHYRRSLLAQLAGGFHHLGVEVVPNPMTLLDNIFGKDIFQSRTVLVKPTLSALGGASGPFSRGKPLRRRSIFQNQLPAGKAGVPCLASDRPTYFIDLPISLPLLRIRPGFTPERQGKIRDATEGKSRGKTRLKAAGVLVLFPLKNSSKKSECFQRESNPRPLERRCFRD